MSGGTATTTHEPAEAAQPVDEVAPQHRRRRRGGHSIWAQGEPLVWLIGGGLTLCVLMIAGLLGLIFVQGASTFWPKRLVQVELAEGGPLLGEVTRGEWFTPGREDDSSEMVGEEVVEAEAGRAAVEQQYRQLLRTGNRDLTGTSFQWVPDAAVVGESQPEWAVLIERRKWGPLLGWPERFTRTHEREVGEREAALADALELLRRSAAADDDANAAALEQTEQELAGVRAEGVEAFLDQFDLEGEAQFEAVLAGGETVELTAANRADLAERAVTVVRQSWQGEAAAWTRFEEEHDVVLARREQRKRLERHDLGLLNYQQESARLGVREQELQHDLRLLEPAEAMREARAALARIDRRQESLDETLQWAEDAWGGDSPQAQAAAQAAEAERERLVAEQAAAQQRLDDAAAPLADIPAAARAAVKAYVEDIGHVQREQSQVLDRIAELEEANENLQMSFTTTAGAVAMPLAEIVRGYAANQLNWTERIQVYGSRWWEFLSDNPREANQEGGVLPPIIGTVTMTLLMCFVVVPFGVLAALYLREYAKPGPIVSVVRIAVNNLAGVPSIVFGVFGLGFFCYIVGGYVDEGPANPAADGPWLAMVGVLVAIVLAAVWASALKLRATDERRLSVRLLGWAVVGLWVVTAAVTAWLVVKVPFFDGFYTARAADGLPTFRKGGVLWASLTLALLTLPVVIVATEEALAAVPRSMREGSYACGASKWQTVRRIVLPRAMPGILTGMILAMARGAGEVAPLMLVGAVTLAQDLPLDAQFPYVHLDRSFMHLGFHIYDVGFQSPDSEGAKPMVYTTTLLLIGLIATLNMAAFALRSRLRRRFAGSQF